jgi:transcriptional regulator with XRE-family HTH domain
MSFNGFYQRLGKIIRKHRERKNYSQEYVAEASQVDRTYIARIESGKANPTIKVLYKIAKIFELPVGEFLKDL